MDGIGLRSVGLRGGLRSRLLRALALLPVKVPQRDRVALSVRRQHLVWHAVVGVEYDESVNDGRHVNRRRPVLRREGLEDAQLAAVQRHPLGVQVKDARQPAAVAALALTGETRVVAVPTWSKAVK